MANERQAKSTVDLTGILVCSVTDPVEDVKPEFVIFISRLLLRDDDVGGLVQEVLEGVPDVSLNQDGHRSKVLVSGGVDNMSIRYQLVQDLLLELGEVRFQTGRRPNSLQISILKLDILKLM